MPPSDFLWAGLWRHILINDCCERSQFIVGSSTPGQVPGFHKNKLSKQRPLGASASVLSCPDFPKGWTVMGSCKPKKIFPPQVAFSHSLRHTNGKPTRTDPIHR